MMVGAVFGIVGGIWMGHFGAEALDPATPQGRIMVHLFTLGVMLSFMLGALFQMLPVIAGVVLKMPTQLAAAVQYPFVLGVGALLVGFWTTRPWAFIAAAVLLGGALLPLIGLLLRRLGEVTHHSPSSRGMMAALISLAGVVGIGLSLVGVWGGGWDGAMYLPLRTLHYSFGLYGWIALLIVSISFQVIEMFYVTPPHPQWMRRGFGWGLLGVLLLLGGAEMVWPTGIPWLQTVLSLMLISYGTVTLHRLTQRKRPLTDATVWFWRIGLTSLIASMLLSIVPPGDAYPFLPPLQGVLFGLFGVSILFAMLYKIIPFLTWFHLNSQGYFTAPMMHEIIHPRTARLHLYLHLGSGVLLLVSVGWAPMAHAAGVAIALSFGWILYHTIHATSLYRHTQETGEKIAIG